MRFTIEHTDKIVGIFILISIILLIGVIVFMGIGKSQFRAKNHYYTIINKTYGLKEGADVIISGVIVGRITSIGFDENSSGIRVDMDVFREYAPKIRMDSFASVPIATLVGGIIGGAGIEIEPGSPKQEEMPNGSRIPSEDVVNKLLKEAGLEEMTNNLKATLANLTTASEKINKTIDEINPILANINSITTDINAGKGSIGAIIKDDKKLYEQLSTTISELSTTLIIVGDAVKDVKKITENVVTITEKADAFVDTSSALISQINALTNSLEIILVNIEKISQDLAKATTGIPELAQTGQEISNDTKQILESLQRSRALRTLGIINTPSKKEAEGINGQIRENHYEGESKDKKFNE